MCREALGFTAGPCPEPHFPPLPQAPLLAPPDSTQPSWAYLSLDPGLCQVCPLQELQEARFVLQDLTPEGHRLPQFLPVLL